MPVRSISTSPDVVTGTVRDHKSGSISRSRRIVCIVCVEFEQFELYRSRRIVCIVCDALCHLHLPSRHSYRPAGPGRFRRCQRLRPPECLPKIPAPQIRKPVESAMHRARGRKERALPAFLFRVWRHRTVACSGKARWSSLVSLRFSLKRIKALGQSHRVFRDVGFRTSKERARV
jgi:hypothetical protein